MILRKNIYLHTGDKIAISLMAASAVALTGALVYTRMAKAKAPPKLKPVEIYKGLGIYVTKDKDAWRWTVKGKSGAPVATGLAVLPEEARLLARKWIDLMGAGA